MAKLGWKNGRVRKKIELVENVQKKTRSKTIYFRWMGSSISKTAYTVKEWALAMLVKKTFHSNIIG